MLTPLQRGYRFMRGDASLTLAVVILSAYIFVLGPLAEIRQINRLGLDVVFALFLAAGARFVFEPRAILRLFMIFLGLTVVLRALDHFIDDQWLTAVSAACSAIGAFFLGALFLARSLRDGRMNSHRIMGAVGAFLLIGIVFAQAFRVLALFVPGAFSVGGRTLRERRLRAQRRLLQLHHPDVAGLRRHRAAAPAGTLAGDAGGRHRSAVPGDSRRPARGAGGRVAAGTARTPARGAREDRVGAGSGRLIVLAGRAAALPRAGRFEPVLRPP